MTVTIELSPEIEAGLHALAASQGVGMQEYLQHMIAKQVPACTGKHLSLAERIAAWEDVGNLPVTPLLSDEAISRESMYGSRG